MRLLMNSNVELEGVLEALIRNQQIHAAREPTEALKGKPSGLRCSCGGELFVCNPFREAAESRLRKHKPWSRNRRIAKKQKKAFYWNPVNMALSLAIPVSGRGVYICATCGCKESFYSAIGKNIVRVEPMPPGAKAYHE